MALSWKLTIPAVLVPAVAAQTPREPVRIAGGLEFAAPRVASDGDVSAIAYIPDELAVPHRNEVLLTWSDGRGLAWSDPIRVDESFPETTKRSVQVAVLRELVFVFWSNTKHPSPSTVFYNVLDVSTGTLSGERRLDTVHGPGAVRGYTLLATSDASADLVYVLFTVGDPETGLDELYLTVSDDGACSFAEPHRLTPAGVSNVWTHSLFAEGSSVYVAWADDRGDTIGKDLFFQRSHAAGAPGSFLASDIQIDTDGPGGLMGGATVDALGDEVAVAWMAPDADQPHAELPHVRVSLDGGETFGDDVVVAHFDALAWGSMAIDRATGNVVVGWADDHPPSGVYDAYVATSVDGGSTWSPPRKLSSGGGSVPGILSVAPAAPGERPLTVATWLDVHDGPLQPYAVASDLRAAVSVDGGVTWQPSVTVDRTIRVGGSWSVASNPVYRNLQYAWAKKDKGETVVLAGGFRPQTLKPSGFEPGSTSAAFGFELFDPGSDPFAWALLALEPGDLLEVQGKVLGLAPDGVFAASLDLAAAGVLSAPLDGVGTGSTGPIPVTLPPGLVLHAVGVGLDPSEVAVGSITDVVAIGR